MILYDFTDALPAQCDTALRVNDGLCFLCLLQAGLTEAEDSRSESLDTLLSEIE
jgi:hypothetical protein